MLRLIQGYYHFLMLGKFMEQLMLTNDLSDLAMDYPLRTGKTTSFMLKERIRSRGMFMAIWLRLVHLEEFSQ